MRLAIYTCILHGVKEVSGLEKSVHERVSGRVRLAIYTCSTRPPIYVHLRAATPHVNICIDIHIFIHACLLYI